MKTRKDLDKLVEQLSSMTGKEFVLDVSAMGCGDSMLCEKIYGGQVAISPRLTIRMLCEWTEAFIEGFTKGAEWMAG